MVLSEKIPSIFRLTELFNALNTENTRNTRKLNFNSKHKYNVYFL